MIKRITGPELKQKLDNKRNLTILEALPAKYYRKAHIPGAINFPLEDMETLAAQLLPDKKAEIVVYCANGPCENSEIAARRLEELGYVNVSDYYEGKEEWMQLGFPVAKGTAPFGEGSAA